MSSNETQSTEQCSANETVEMLPMELERRRCEAGNDGNTMYSENSISFSDKATEPRNLNLRIENRSLVIVQQSLTKQQQPNWEHTFLKRETKHANGGEVQSDSAPKTKGSLLDQHKRPAELVACQLQTFGDTQQRSQTEWRDTFIASVDPPIPLIEKQGYLNGQECERILKKLEFLQDDGKFAEHERLVTACIQRFADGENPDMELALKIERGVASSYQKEFKNSKPDYRNRKPVKFSPLFEFLQRSEFLLQNHDSPEDWAELYYNYGSVWLKYMSIIPDDLRNAQARETARDKAKYYYEQAVSFCQRDKRPRVQIKKQTYCHLKLAALLLDCSSTAVRTQEKEVAPSDIKKAKEHLDFVQYRLGESVPTGTQVQLLKTRSDQFYRQRLYQLAKETAEEAFQLASSNRFNTELDTLQERIQFLDVKLEVAKEVAIVEIEDTHTESCYSGTE
ncbi:uncharacterized protein [Pocillopora verrucosa]|uniref:uncharacterized protein n=1 Tax=Pocillopora verrucosa TaxID=203993 RepID=UPI003340AC82